MKMMPPDVISHENQLQHLPEPSIFILDVFRTADHAGQIFIPHRPPAAICAKPASRPRKLLSREPAEKNIRLSRRENCGLDTEKSITKVFRILKLFATACFSIPRRRCYGFLCVYVLNTPKVCFQCSAVIKSPLDSMHLRLAYFVLIYD